MNMDKKKHGILLIFPILLTVSSVLAKDQIELTLDNAVEISMRHSYQIRRLKLGIERSTMWLKARQADLKSNIFLNLKTPDLQNISDYKWNSVLYRDEIVHQNTQMWQSELSIRQPVMLLGYPTNGYVSLNYKVYRYGQQENGSSEVDFYNRLYVKFEQPFFKPNELKNDLEEAQLNLRDIQLNYISQRMNIIDDISDDYYDAFQFAYYEIIYQNQLQRLEQVFETAKGFEKFGNGHKKDRIQVQLEIANVRENLLENKSRLRMELADIKQRLNLNFDDSLFVRPVIDLKPVTIDLNQAIHYGFTLNPRLQRLGIYKRHAEIDLENIGGYNKFHMTLEATYGLEKSNHRFTNMWTQYDNSNSVTLNAYVPLWDWGRRRYRIEAEKRDVNRRILDIEEREEYIRKNITTSYTNLMEYQARFENMEESRRLAEEITELSIPDYQNGDASLQDILQIITRHRDTEIKLMDAFIGYKRAYMSLVDQTYYDFAQGMSVMETLSEESH